MAIVEFGDFKKIKKVVSPTYGEYFVTKIATINLIEAIQQKQLSPSVSVYHKLKEQFGTMKVVKLQSKLFGPLDNQQELDNFEVYVPILEDNTKWEPLPNSHKSFKKGKLPVAYKMEYVQKIVNKIK